MKYPIISLVFSVLWICCIHYPVFSQSTDDTTRINHFMASATLTNNGMSFIPTFTLGKPAAIFDLSMGRRFSFEPQFRFALEGKPWSFLFWFRYDLVKNKAFQLKIGAHPALSFKEMTYITETETIETMVVRRYLAAELAPTWTIGKNGSAGIYYLASHGIEKDITQYTHFVALRGTVSNIKLTRAAFLRLSPQVYYLNMDHKEGYYVSGTIGMVVNNFPLSVTSMLNKTIETEIAGSKDFSWNVSLIYTFSRNYIARN